MLEAPAVPDSACAEEQARVQRLQDEVREARNALMQTEEELSNVQNRLEYTQVCALMRMRSRCPPQVLSLALLAPNCRVWRSATTSKRRTPRPH